MLKQLRERYGEVLAEHQRLLEAAFDRHGGRVVDTQGDSFFVVFGSARGAVLAAIEAQRALAEHDWPDGADLRVRMGIHSGQAAASEETYLGLAVHRAARISASGHGGQILVSQTTQNLLEDEEETSGVEFRDLGQQRLKDLDRPVHVYQVAAEGLEREFPPLRTDALSPAAEPEHRHPRRRTILVGALAGVIAAAVAIPIFAFGGGSGGGGLGEATGDAIGSIDAKTGDVEGGVELPGAPTAVAAGLGSLWALSSDSNQVYAIDLDTNNVRDKIDVGNAPAGIAVGGEFIWVTNSLDGTVTQISPQGQVLDEINVGNGPTGIAFDKERGYVWVANTADHRVAKIDARTGKLLKTYPAGTDPVAVAVGEGAIWIASKSGDAVVKLSPGSGQLLKTIAVGQSPAAVAVGLGSAWVANSDDGTVWQIDPASGSVRDSIEVGAGPTGIAIVGRQVWTANELAGTVSRIDLATNQPTSVALESVPTAVADGGDTIYVALRPTGMAHRGGTLTVAVSTDIPLQTLDPAVGSFSPLRFVGLTNDGLLAYRHVGGQAGLELVPDLAVAPPDVSPDGKTYTFQVRRNVRYSNGDPVKARDFRYAIEREYRLGGEPLSGLRGAGRCNRRHCDLSAGIVTDDAGRTVTFHLSAPDPYFLYSFPNLYVVPFGTSLREAKRRPLPGTGPYRLASGFNPLSVRLVRNPRFREWSKAAQPAGFPDEIVLQGVPAEKKRIALVEGGKADLTGVGGEVPPRLRPLVHANPGLFTLYLALNTNRPPFDDVRARRALNYAVDRNKVVRLRGGKDVARPTCQVLPPNFPGYRRYCPYTLDPNDNGSWTAPDTVKATGLIADSGTAGTQVTLWVPPFAAGAGVARYLRKLLESLHYRVDVRSSFGPFARLNKDQNKDPFMRYFARLEAGAMLNRRGSPQIAWDGWGPDYPAASNFIQPLFSCGSKGSPNATRFCDPAFEQKMRRAAELEQTDPAISNGRWAELDREITDKAVLVPLFNSYGADLVSKRVGHYQYNPQLGALLSQLWVR